MVRFSGVSTRFWRLYAGEKSREARLQLCFAQSGSKLHIYLNVFFGEDGHVCVRSIVYYSQCLFSLRITSLLSLSEQFSVIFSLFPLADTHTHTTYFRENFINTRHSWQSEWVRGDRNWVKEGWRLVICLVCACVCICVCVCPWFLIDWVWIKQYVFSISWVLEQQTETLLLTSTALRDGICAPYFINTLGVFFTLKLEKPYANNLPHNTIHTELATPLLTSLLLIHYLSCWGNPITSPEWLRE